VEKLDGDVVLALTGTLSGFHKNWIQVKAVRKRPVFLLVVSTCLYAIEQVNSASGFGAQPNGPIRRHLIFACQVFGKTSS
jgi:hypothetical protein